MKYPSTVVLNINIHGSISTNAQQPDTFTLPDELDQLTTITAVQTGVCNMTNQHITETTSEAIREVLSKYDVNMDLYSCALEIQQRLRDINTNTSLPMFGNLKASDFHPDYRQVGEEHARQFNRYSDKMYNLNTYTGNATILNKLFSYKKSDEQEHDGIYAKAVTIVNMIGTPNLLHLMSLRSNRKSETTMEHMVEFLVNKGVTKILVIDSSCSAVVDTIKHKLVSSRLARSIRRTYQGGKRKRKLRKVTSRRHTYGRLTRKSLRKQKLAVSAQRCTI